METAPGDVRTRSVAPTDPVTLPRSTRGWAWIRGVLLALWLALAALTVLGGVRDTTYADLEAGLASGRVDHVAVSGGLPAGATGSATFTVTWRDGLFRDRASLTQATSAREARASRMSDSGRYVVGSVRGSLTRGFPDVTVVRAPDSQAMDGGSVWEVNVPSWLLVGFAVAFLGTLGTITGGPKPWRATRWAWFWVCTMPGGALAFLVLSGPSWPLPAPRAGHRRLTGGFAFLLTLVVGAWH